jgi:hypothetical protein
MAWVASAHVCARPIVLSMPAGASMPRMDMPGMDMSGMDMSGMDMASGSMPMLRTPAGTMMLCPVVVGLIALSALLGTWAIVTACRDRHRALTLRVLMRALAQLPVVRTFGALAGAGGLAIAAIVAVDGHGSFGPALVVTLTFILAGISLGATIASLVLARCITALYARLLIAVAGAIAARRGPQRAFRLPAPCPPHAAVVAITFGRGLRAPPPPAH